MFMKWSVLVYICCYNLIKIMDKIEGADHKQF